MNLLWTAMMLAALACALAFGRGELMVAAMSEAAASAVTLALTLAGGYAMWCGLLSVAQSAGVLDGLSRALRRPLSLLFPGTPADGPAMRHIAANLAANALGLGNAATPEGMSAVRELAKGARNATATDDMVMFLVINCSSVQLLPTTVIALRAAAGSASPGDVVIPTLLATGLSTLVGVLAARAGARFFRR